MKLLPRLLIALLMLSTTPALASQAYAPIPNTGTLSGLQAVNDMNANTDALLTNSAGSTAPAYGVEGTFFANTTSNFMQVYDGVDWDTVFSWTTGQVTINFSTLAAPVCGSSTTALGATATGFICQTLSGGGGGSSSLSSITSATTTSSINSGTNAIAWGWANTTQNALTFSTSALTTGQLLTLSNSNAAATTGVVLALTNTATGASKNISSVESGAANTGYAGYFSNTGTGAVNYALYATASSTTGYAGYFQGNVNVTGVATIGTPLGVASGGWGLATLTSNAFYKGNGTSAPAVSALSDNGSFVVVTGEDVDGTTRALSFEYLNDTTTGTTLNKLAKVSTAGKALRTATADVDGSIGIVIGGAATSGSSQIAYAGEASCIFDGATTAGDFVSISSTTVGDCHDAGSARPTAAQTIGRVLSTNASGGTFAISIGLDFVNTAGGGSGTVNAGTSGQLAYYASSTAAVSGNANMNISGGALTLGTATSTLGSVVFSGSTSGTTTLSPNVTASGTLTLPAATDTLIGKATTDTLTNKTFNTAGTGNSFSINGTAITAVTGTGAVALAASPTFTGTVGAAAITATGVVTGGAFVAPPDALTISTATFTPVSVGSNTFRVVLVHASCPCTIANPSGSAVDGAKFILEVWQSATGSDAVGTWGTNYDFGTAGTPTLSTGANKGDFLGFSYSAQNSKYNYIGIQQGM